MNKFMVIVTAIIAVIVSSGCAAPVSPTAILATKPTLDMAPAKIRFGVTNVALPTMIIAEDQGFFAKENLTLEKNTFGSGGLVTDALAANQLDMGTTNPILTILATAKGAKVVMISGIEYTFTDKSGKSWEAVYVLVRDGEGIQKLTDLKGKKVAVSDIGSSYNYLLRATMLANNIDPDKDMSIVPVPYAQMPGALMQKLVDAIIITADGYLQVQKLGKVTAIATHTSLARLDMDITTPLGVNTDFLQKNPDVVVRFLRALIQARQWMSDDIAKNNGKNLIDSVSKAMKYSPELAQSFYETRAGYYGKDLDFINLLDVPARSMNRNVEALKINSLLPQDASVTYDQIVNIQPLKRAYETLGLKWDESKH